MLYFFFAIIVACFAVVGLFYWFQRSLTYFPEHSTITPQEAGVPEMEVVALTTEDGLQLKAWYCPPKEAHLPTVVYFHGNAGHIGYRASLVRPYIKAGFGVFLLTYRGYSANPGKPSEEGLYRDARASIEFLKGQDVVLFGESIGAAVAIQMALEFPIKAIILQAPFTTLADVGAYHYPFIPIRLLLKDKYNSLAKASNVQVPVCIIHGENDGIIPPAMSQKLFNAFQEPKTLHLVPHTGHNDLFEPTFVINFLKNRMAS